MSHQKSKIPIESFSLLENGVKNQERVKVYKRRWYILFVYMFYAAMNSIQWFEYSIITNVIMKYYNVTPVQVDWTSIIYMSLYMPMVIPASYLIDKKGLRFTAIIGSLGTALGTVVKMFAINQNRIWVVYLGQTILSSMQVFILALPVRIASVWFGPKEVSLACAMGVFGTQLGQAIGFCIPPLVVKSIEDVDAIGKELGALHYYMAGFATSVAVAVVMYFPANPEIPPSSAQIEARKKLKEKTINFTKSLKILMSDWGFLCHIVAYGINIATFISMSTLLSQFVEFYFPESKYDAGNIGLLMIIAGMVGALIFGYILDKTHKYKETTLGLYTFSSIGMVAFLYALEKQKIVVVYLTAGFLGLFMNAYVAVGLELGTELTYPEPESTQSGILISMTQTMGVFLTLFLGWIAVKCGPFWALSSLVIFLCIGNMLTAIIPNRVQRQEAFKKHPTVTNE